MALPNLAVPFFRVSLLNSMVSTRGGGFRVAPPPACLVLGARKSPSGTSAAQPKTPRESGFEKVLGSGRRRHFLSSRPRLVPCSREDGARFAQAAPLPPAVHSLGKPGLKRESNEQFHTRNSKKTSILRNRVIGFLKYAWASGSGAGRRAHAQCRHAQA